MKPGQNLLHYEMIEKIGAGGMGVVWKALDTTLRREVAIRVVKFLQRRVRQLCPVDSDGFASDDRSRC